MCSTTPPPHLPKQLVFIHPNMPNMGLFPPSPTNANASVALGADWHFQFILFVPHTVCVGVQTFQICSWALHTPWRSVNVSSNTATLQWCHTHPWLTSCSPGDISFPHEFQFEALFISPTILLPKVCFPHQDRWFHKASLYLVSGRLFHSLKPQSFGKAQVLEPGIDLLGLPVTSKVLPLTGRIKNYLCSWIF